MLNNVAPPSTELKELYVGQRLTAREIAARYGVAHVTVLRWLRASDIPRRAPRNGLANRGVQPPTAGELQRLIYDARLSYRQVGELYGVDQSAIPYWLDKFEIPRPTRTRIDPAHVGALYSSGVSAESIAAELGCCKTTVLNFLRRLDIDRRTEGWRARLEARDGTMVRSTYELRVADWLHAHKIAYEYEPAVPFGHGNTRSDFLANGWYIEVWGVHSRESYKRQKNRKQRLYAELGLPLIELSPHHFAGDRHLFERRMTQCLDAPQCGSDQS